jgi:hypothetical protein
MHESLVLSVCCSAALTTASACAPGDTHDESFAGDDPGAARPKWPHLTEMDHRLVRILADRWLKREVPAAPIDLSV